MQAVVSSLQQQQQQQQGGGGDGGAQAGPGAPPGAAKAPVDDLGSSLPVVSTVLLAVVLIIAGLVGWVMHREAQKEAYLNVSGGCRGGRMLPRRADAAAAAAAVCGSAMPLAATTTRHVMPPGAALQAHPDVRRRLEKKASAVKKPKMARK